MSVGCKSVGYEGRVEGQVMSVGYEGRVEGQVGLVGTSFEAYTHHLF
jgi:hypothetical protein